MTFEITDYPDSYVKVKFKEGKIIVERGALFIVTESMILKTKLKQEVTRTGLPKY